MNVTTSTRLMRCWFWPALSLPIQRMSTQQLGTASCFPSLVHVMKKYYCWIIITFRLVQSELTKIPLRPFRFQSTEQA